MIKEKLGGRLDGWLHTLLPFLFTRSVNPNLLSVLGALVSLGAAYAFAVGSLRAGGLLMLAGGVFDLIDGVVARHHGTSSSFGAFLDSTLDRLVDVAVLLGIIVHYAGEGAPELVLAGSIALAASVLTSYAKARAETMIPSLDAGFFERGERVVLLTAGAILGLLPWALLVVAFGATITVVQRVTLAYRELNLLDAGHSAPQLGEDTEETA